MTIVYSLIAVFVISLLAFSGIVFLPFKELSLRKVIFWLVSLSVGAMLGDSMIHLLPKAFEAASSLSVAFSALFGILLFFMLEKFMHWRHSHGVDEETAETDLAHKHADNQHVGMLLNVADGVHNFIDGLIIAGSFIVSTELGIATTVAVILHEIPQEVANFGLLIHMGYTRRKALFWNFISALTAFLGVGIAFAFNTEKMMAVLVAFAAGGFIYIALSDLVPELQSVRGKASNVLQVVGILLGIGLMALLLLFE